MSPRSRSRQRDDASQAILFRKRRRRSPVGWTVAALLSLVVLTALLMSMAGAPSVSGPEIVRGQAGDTGSSQSPSQSAGITRTAGLPIHKQGDFGVPKRLKIPKVRVDAAVVPVGLTSAGAMDAPESAKAVGWFMSGPRPGQSGSSVLDGHSGMASGGAVFDRLTDLRKGDRVYVADASDSYVTFVVTGRRFYPADETVDAVFAQGGPSRLNLITCTGTWDSVRKTHTKRLVVFTEAEF